jgi:ferredoxin-NADP reductase
MTSTMDARPGLADDADWTPTEDLDGFLRCTEVHQVTHDVRSFVLQPLGPVAFTPGQYLTVTVDVDGQQLSRCYSIASSAARTDSLTITVKRVRGGPVSNWLHDHVRPGDHLQVTGPYGVFTPGPQVSRRQLYLSAGSGITPLMSMARTIVDQRIPADVLFVHHARSPEDIIFRDELDAIPARHRGIKTVVACEADGARETWAGHRGRISSEFLDIVSPDLAERDIFICGPAPYMEATRAFVLARGAVPSRVHEESYVFGTTSDPSGPAGDRAAVTYDVEFARSGQVVPCDDRTSVLEAATQAGLTLPSSCREGACGTCKTRLISGQVDMEHAGGIRPREIAQNQILLCCSTPTTDLVVDA